jgi:succinate-semialdehyde dehydrogenase / glutarate-semialdehyde dehydrogenase
MTVTELPHPVPDEVYTYITSLDSVNGLDTFDVVDPATGAVIAAVANGGAGDARAAVDAADGTFAEWAATPPRRRSDVLHRAFEIMLAEAEPLAQLISLENGKPLADAGAEIGYAAEFFRWFAEEAVRPDGRYGPAPAGGTRTIVTTRPVGIAALVTPWNFPAAMATRKIGPALAAGCTVVLKPAAETPLTALAVARILGRAGAPPGVVTVVPTTHAAEVVSTWMADPRSLPRPPTGWSTPRWSWAATRRSSSPPTRTSRRPWPGR